MTPHLPNRPADPARPPADILNNSNSTASIFLGGARKSWMVNVDRSSTNRNQIGLPAASRATNNNNSDPQRVRSPATTPSLPAIPAPSCPSCPTPLDVSPVATPPPPPPVAPDPSQTRLSGMRDSPSHYQENLASFGNNNGGNTLATPSAVASPAQRSLQNVPPGPTPPQITPNVNKSVQSLTHTSTAAVAASSAPLPAPVRPAPFHQQKQHLQLPRPPALQIPQFSQHQPSAAVLSSLPSPDPTVTSRSHTSPTSAIDRNGPVAASPSLATFPSPPNGDAASIPSLRQNVPPVGAMAVPPTNNLRHAIGAPPLPQLSRGNSRTSHRGPPPRSPATAITPTTPVIRPAVPIPGGPTQNGPGQSQGSVTFPVINDAFFDHSRAYLESYATSTRHGMLLSETVEAPRVSLIRNACVEKDLVFLVLHQIYCLSSYAPSEFNRMPGFTAKHFQGIETLRHLLVDNRRVSGDFLGWCIRFPRPIPLMLNVPAYQAALRDVSHILACFADNWLPFERAVRSRGFPPLVEELTGGFNILSPVLQSNVVRCLCRRIPGMRREDRLQEIFNRDLENFRTRYIRRPSREQIQRELDETIFAYKSIFAPQNGDVPTPAMMQAAPRPTGVSNTPTATTPLQFAAPVAASQSGPAQTTHPVAPAHIQTQVHPLNGTTPAGPVRSAPAAAPIYPSTPISTYPGAQNVTLSPNVALLQNTNMISSPTVATTPSYAARHDWRPTYQAQQPTQPVQQLRQGNSRAVQDPRHSAQMPVDPRFAAPNSQPSVARRIPRGPTLLLPPAGAPSVLNIRPNPNRVALHQAIIRDPLNRLISRGATGEEETELFPYLDSLVVPATPLGKTEGAFHWQFSLSRVELQRLPPIQSQGAGRRLLRILVEGNQLYRLRCVKVSPSATTVSNNSWCVAETVWPSVVYVFVNKVELFVRRKVHNGRDIPLDITPYLQEGTNQVSVHFIRSPSEFLDLTYAMAVESLTLGSFSQVKDLAQSSSAAESRRQICNRLAPDQAADDELSIVSDDLTVTLVDPFTARLFNVPVRGRFCTHPECFDHDTFLQTRALKSPCYSLEADWKCPICRQDARPQSLVVDGFLAEIRAEMEHTNQCAGARALQVKSDGSWEVKTESDLPSPVQGSSQPPEALAKRKSNVLGNTCTPTPQRAKIEQSPSVPIPEGPEDDQPTHVIILD